MPAPFELSEEEAAERILRAIRDRRWDYAFPLPTGLLVKLANILPKRLTAAILRRDFRAQRARLSSMKAAGSA